MAGLSGPVATHTAGASFPRVGCVRPGSAHVHRCGRFADSPAMWPSHGGMDCPRRGRRSRCSRSRVRSRPSDPGCTPHAVAPAAGRYGLGRLESGRVPAIVVRSAMIGRVRGTWAAGSGRSCLGGSSRALSGLPRSSLACVVMLSASAGAITPGRARGRNAGSVLNIVSGTFLGRGSERDRGRGPARRAWGSGGSPGDFA